MTTHDADGHEAVYHRGWSWSCFALCTDNFLPIDHGLAGSSDLT